MKTILPLILMVAFATSVDASPIDDASTYSVRVKSTVRYAFAEDVAGTSHGAGFLINRNKGWVLTNAHVSGHGTGEVEVSFKGNDYFEAKLVYVDPELDLAVIRVKDKNIPSTAKAAELDCGDRPLNGVPVAAFGHPHSLTYSASRGIISKLRYYHGVDWIQTDAAINPGNSGGPLIDLGTGKVVGINAMAIKDTEGLNFAVPAKAVCKVLDLLMIGEDPSPPKLPIRFAVNTESEEYLIVGAAAQNDLPVGFLSGDRLTKVGSQYVETPTALKTYLRGKTGNVNVLVKRGDKEVKVALPFSPERLILDRQYVKADGAVVAEDPYPERRGLEGFYHVQSVREGSYAERSGWIQYRLIMSIDGTRPTSLSHINDLLSGENKKVIIFRGWSAQDNKMHDYHEISYWPYKVELKRAGE